MIKQCVLPIAGMGTRFSPITKVVPKEMLPIGNKPLLQYAIEEAKDAQLEHITFVTSPNKSLIQDYFNPDFSTDTTLEGITELDELSKAFRMEYILQKSQKGLGAAVLDAKETLQEGEPFVVMLPDDYCDATPSVTQQLSEVYQQHQCAIVAVERVSAKEINRYGIIQGTLIDENTHNIEFMVEKPPLGSIDSNLAIIGRYVLPYAIFNKLERLKATVDAGEELQLTNAISQLLEDSRVIAYEFSGKRFDCGQPEGYKQANANEVNQ